MCDEEVGGVSLCRETGGDVVAIEHVLRVVK